MPEARKITKTTTNKAKATAKSRTKSQAKTKVKGEGSIKRAEPLSPSITKTISAAADVTNDVDEVLQQSKTQTAQSQESRYKDDRRKPQENGTQPSFTVKVRSVGRPDWRQALPRYSGQNVVKNVQQELRTHTLTQPLPKALLSELCLLRAPIIHAMAADKALYAWLENDCRNDLVSDPDNFQPRNCLTWYEPLLTTRELRKYNVVGVKAHIALMRTPENDRHRLPWQLVEYKSSDKPLIGTLWFAVLRRDKMEVEKQHSSASSDDPGSKLSTSSSLSSYDGQIGMGAQQEQGRRQHIPEDVDGNFYWNPSHNKGNRLGVISIPAENNQSYQRLGNRESETRSRSGFCWGLEACGPNPFK